MTNSSIQDRNKEIVQRLTSEAWTGKNIDLVDEFVSGDYIEYAPFGEIRGINGYKEGIRLFTTAFPDLDTTIEDSLAERDRVAFRLTATGTHEGEFMGIEPTGNSITFSAMDITRLEDEKVVEEWISMDLLGLFEQLDAISSSVLPPIEN